MARARYVRSGRRGSERDVWSGGVKLCIHCGSADVVAFEPDFDFGGGASYCPKHWRMVRITRCVFWAVMLSGVVAAWWLV